MDALEVLGKIEALLDEVQSRHPEELLPYTRGYIDALVYLAEWLEEEVG